MHNVELAKTYQVSPALTQEECPAKLGVTYLYSKCFALVWKHCYIVCLVELKIRWQANQCLQHKRKV